jgi:hypothetical protein
MLFSHDGKGEIETVWEPALTGAVAVITADIPTLQQGISDATT